MTYQKYLHPLVLLVFTKCNFHFWPKLTHQISPSRARRLTQLNINLKLWKLFISPLKVTVTFRRACKKSGVGALWKFTVRHLQNLKGPKLFWSTVNSPMRDIRLIFAIFGGHKGPKNMGIGPNFPCHTYVTICITKAKGILEWQRSSY